MVSYTEPLSTPENINQVTLLRTIMAGSTVAGKNNYGLKYGEFSKEIRKIQPVTFSPVTSLSEIFENLPNFTYHYLNIH